MPDFVRVASTSDLADGEMRQVTAGDTDVLLSRVDGEFHACTAFCTHYGAPLATGVLDGTTVVCPWHHAAFDVTSGALCEPPAADALRTFEVQVEGDDVRVRVPDDADTHGKGIAYRESDGAKPDMAELATDADERLFLIVGAGAAGQACAEELRALGYRGRLAMITRETHAPYDRTVLSKGFLAGTTDESALRLRDGSFYEAHGIELWTDRVVTKLDPESKTVSFKEGEDVTYDVALVSTGGEPRRLDIPGGDLSGVHLLRSWRDAEAIVSRTQGAASVVIIGTSFIGMESASSLRDRDLDVTVIGRDDVPLVGALGQDVGGVFLKAAQEKGVEFRLGADVQRIETVASDPGTGAPRRLRVVLADGEVEADVVLMGVGVTPATDFLNGADFRRDDGGLVVDETLRAVPGLFAAGDVAAFPGAHGTVRIEHWRLAQQHGRTAARNMVIDRTRRPSPTRSTASRSSGPGSTASACATSATPRTGTRSSSTARSTTASSSPATSPTARSGQSRPSAATRTPRRSTS